MYDHSSASNSETVQDVHSGSSSHTPGGSFSKPQKTVHKHNMCLFADDPFTAKENKENQSFFLSWLSLTLLYGYPIFVGIREKTNDRNPDGSAKRQSQIFQSGAAKTFKKFFIKTLYPVCLCQKSLPPFLALLS
ncbi:uncharacterized protein LOC144619201 [Crassostrea virginica]